jgi:uncharacterized repeat protein (TIGR03806 family)
MSRVLLAALGLLVFSCQGKGKVDAADAGDTDTDTDGDTDTDTDTDIVTGDFGLETRPANTTCVAPEPPPSAGQATLTRVFTSLPPLGQATAIAQAPGDPDHWYILDQNGRIYRFDDDPGVSALSMILDIRGEVLALGDPGAASNEQGLLGIAFHPDFQANGFIYVAYTGAGPQERVTRYHTDDGGASFDAGSALRILTIDDPYSNHNGGWLEFGPDGFLYIAYGDGGSGDDPEERAQDKTELLGKFLRIDIDNPSGGNEYGIPADNPYAAGGGRPEIYTIGMRNPYRFHFDTESGRLYAGDVGQDDIEEIDLIERGGNYGWDIMEADACHEPASNCDRGGLILPLATYPHDGGSKSVIGGVVYHGALVPALAGVYLYDDYYDGTIYGLTSDPVTGEPVSYRVINNSGRSIGHWAVGDDGETYALDYSAGIYQLQPAGDVVDSFPKRLSETGCVDPADPWEPNASMIPYDINHAFWSDGAEKGRWMAIPDGTTVDVDADGDWDLPIGTVLLKRFEKDGERPETRLVMRHPDGHWAGYSYVWRDDGSDADLADGAVAIDLPSETWTVPSRAECVQCHTVVAGGSLGLEDRQMNRAVTYPSTGITAPQIATLAHIGWLTAAPDDTAALGAFPAIDDASASTEDKARAWLHVNCAQCHQPGGPTTVNLDLRYDTPLADTAVCGPPQAGNLDLGGGTMILAPGDPAKSVLSSRIHRRDASGMPPSGSAIVDDVGAAVIDAWITDLASCP